MCLGSNENGGPRRCAGETRSTYQRRQASLEIIERSHQQLRAAINADAPPSGRSSLLGSQQDVGVLSMATARDRYGTKSYYESRDRGRAEHAAHDLADRDDPAAPPRPGAAELEAKGWPIEGGWIEPRGNGRVGKLEDVDIPKLLALYQAEGAEDAPNGVFTNAFNNAWNAADTHTRQAWRVGYGNPRVTNRGETLAPPAPPAAPATTSSAAAADESDDEDEDEVCSDPFDEGCRMSLNDGEGYDGACGSCADRLEDAGHWS